jgi:Fe-S-cluster-containing hydrogenase component 2
VRRSAMLAKTGVPGDEDVRQAAPSPERLARGRVAVFECFQRIPCDPCADACRVGAVSPLDDINDRPILDHDACSGCGECIARCPGLAIFVVDLTFSDDEDLVVVPFEFLPVPEAGAVVPGVDREGRVVADARVVKAQRLKKYDRTVLLSLAVPKGMGMVVRGVQLGGDENHGR